MIPLKIPDKNLRAVENATDFSYFQCQKMAVGRRFCDVVVVKGTYLLAPGTLALAKERAEIVLSDEYHVNPGGRPSVAVSGDLHLAKPGTDVIVTGDAHAPGGRPAARWDTSVVVRRGTSTLLSHTLEATGPRRWNHRSIGGWSLSSPEPAPSTPIRYELAYGGAYKNPDEGAQPPFVVYEDNPSGTGVFDEDTLDPSRTYDGPRWQLHTSPVTSINRAGPLAGFGPVARHWRSRLKYAGTYDQAWEDKVRADRENGIVPDYAADFDPRFFHCAHPALMTATPLAGDEHIGLAGLAASSPELVFKLPAAGPRAEVLGPGTDWRAHPLPLDTVHIDLTANRVHLCWRMVAADTDDVIAAVILPNQETIP